MKRGLPIGNPLCFGMYFDRATYDGLLLQQPALAQKQARDVRLQQARKAASSAWEKKEYGRFIEAFSAVHENLTEGERQQLN